jgi:hypothetical protein
VGVGTNLAEAREQSLVEAQGPHQEKSCEGLSHWHLVVAASGLKFEVTSHPVKSDVMVSMTCTEVTVLFIM